MGTVTWQGEVRKVGVRLGRLLAGRPGLERIKPFLLQTYMHRFLLRHDDSSRRLSLCLLDPFASRVDDVAFAAFL